MTTTAQKSANSANSRLSTGPRTEQGKQNASRNSAKHYLTAKQIVVPGEDPAAYDELQAGLLESWNPATPQEQLLVDQIAQNAWRLLRVRRLEAATFDYMMPSLDPIAPAGPGASVKRPPANHDEAMAQAFHANAKAFDNVRRYATAIERAYHNAIAELIKLQKERKKTEIGSVSQNPQSPNAGESHAAPSADSPRQDQPIFLSSAICPA
jgi:hypothetical protein